jgi:hypothetical protein
VGTLIRIRFADLGVNRNVERLRSDLVAVDPWVQHRDLGTSGRRAFDLQVSRRARERDDRERNRTRRDENRNGTRAFGAKGAPSLDVVIVNMHEGPSIRMHATRDNRRRENVP